MNICNEFAFYWLTFLTGPPEKNNYLNNVNLEYSNRKMITKIY